LPALPAFPPITQQGFTLNSGESCTISPASYGDISLNSGTPTSPTTLTFDAGDLFLHSFMINSATNIRVQVAPETRIFVQTMMAFRSPFLNASGQLQPVLLGFAGTSLVVETQFNGTLLAPNASVAFGIGSRVSYRGSFYAKSIEVRPGSALICDEGPTPALASVPPPPSCSDGVLDGTETAVDCGGGVCPPCANGKTCLVSSDCQSDDCANGICAQPTQQLTASLTVFSDWGSGYCADLTVNNPTSQPTRSWTATATTGPASIYDTWNGTFSGASGTITITPSFSWNQVIPAGGADHSIGFCANRTPPTSGATPEVVSVAGSF
jgi:cellulase/cellobiase CelA1